MTNIEIRPHMPVLGSDNVEIGRVDHYDGDRIVKLARDDDALHHYIPVTWVHTVDYAVHLNMTAHEVETHWAVRANELST